MTKQVHGQTGAHAPLSRRDFLTRAGLTVGAAAAAAAVPGAAYAVQEGVIGLEPDQDCLLQHLSLSYHFELLFVQHQQ